MCECESFRLVVCQRLAKHQLFQGFFGPHLWRRPGYGGKGSQNPCRLLYCVDVVQENVCVNDVLQIHPKKRQHSLQEYGGCWVLLSSRKCTQILVTTALFSPQKLKQTTLDMRRWTETSKKKTVGNDGEVRMGQPPSSPVPEQRKVSDAQRPPIGQMRSGNALRIFATLYEIPEPVGESLLR